MTSPALTSPFEFKYRTGSYSLLKRKHLRERDKLPARSFDAAIQVFQRFVSTKGKPFKKQIKFIKTPGNGCYHDSNNLKPVVGAGPYSADSGKLDPMLMHKVRGKKFDNYGNAVRTNAQYKAAAKAKRYYSDPDLLPSIKAARQAKNRMKGGSGKVGKHRSEGREAACSILEVLFMNTDILSLRVGRPDVSNKKLFHYATNSALASQGGLGFKRFQRGIELLRDAKILGTSRRYEQLKSGKYVGKASAIWFTREFMKSFDMLNTFNRTAKQLTVRAKKLIEHGVKSAEQVKAEATDALCRAASQVVSVKTVRRDVKELFDLIDTDPLE